VAKTHTQTLPQTHRQDRLQYTAPLASTKCKYTALHSYYWEYSAYRQAESVW